MEVEERKYIEKDEKKEKELCKTIVKEKKDEE